MQRKRDGLLKVDFPVPLGNVSYQIPCTAGCKTLARRPKKC